MQLSIELKGIKEALKKFDPKIIQKSAQRALNRAAKSGKTVISSQIREKFNIKKSDLDKKIDVKAAKLQDLEAKITVTGKPISLIHFGATQISGGIQTFISKDRGIAQRKIRGSKFSGVSVKIIKGKTTKLRSAFIARGKGGTPLVFRRIGKKRLPIRALKVISYASILKKPENLQAVENRIMEEMENTMASNLKLLSEKITE